MQTSRGPKFRDVISELFPQNRQPSGVEVALRQHLERYLSHLTWLEKRSLAQGSRAGSQP